MTLKCNCFVYAIKSLSPSQSLSLSHTHTLVDDIVLCLIVFLKNIWYYGVTLETHISVCPYLYLQVHILKNYICTVNLRI